jgi:DNA polymerase-4
VSYNKFLAKIASDMNKPDGLCVITPAQGPDFVAKLPVRKFHGVGPATAAKLEGFGIVTGEDLRARSLEFLQQKFGKAGHYYHWAARGIDNRPVNPNQERKSIGSETTFRTDLASFEACMAELDGLIETVARHCAQRGIAGKTVTLKLRYADFRTVTRSRTSVHSIADTAALRETIQFLLNGLMPLPQGVRLLGVTLSSLTDSRAPADTVQSSLFDADSQDSQPTFDADLKGIETPQVTDKQACHRETERPSR